MKPKIDNMLTKTGTTSPKTKHVAQKIEGLRPEIKPMSMVPNFQGVPPDIKLVPPKVDHMATKINGPVSDIETKAQKRKHKLLEMEELSPEIELIRPEKMFSGEREKRITRIIKKIISIGLQEQAI